MYLLFRKNILTNFESRKSNKYNNMERCNSNKMNNQLINLIQETKIVINSSNNNETTSRNMIPKIRKSSKMYNPNSCTVLSFSTNITSKFESIN